MGEVVFLFVVVVCIVMVHWSNYLYTTVSPLFPLAEFDVNGGA